MEHRIWGQYLPGSRALCASVLRLSYLGFLCVLKDHLVNSKAWGHQDGAATDPAEAGWAPGGRGSPLRS